MKDQLKKIQEQAVKELSSIASITDLENFRIQYLGKKGHVTSALKMLGELSAEERPEIGQLANCIKAELSDMLEDVRNKLKAGDVKKEYLDITLQGREPSRGHLHPIDIVNREICDIFVKMGYRIVQGPEVELDYYNFEALNIPKDHPARDMQDTFYVSDSVVLRTQTSSMQIRVMEKQQPPVSIIAPGKVYRSDSDVSHTPMFHQVEGLLVDKGITFGDLKGTLTSFVHQMFGTGTALRFRPSFFPFTEPSAEVDIQCVICKGKGCRTCGNSGWIEILGSGMVDPDVYGFVDYDHELYSGFAFGVGIERVTMLKYGIDDIQLFFRNDMRFLRQFY
jgi:phenylalanyl-tRNA synthetase alpha chain